MTRYRWLLDVLAGLGVLACAYWFLQIVIMFAPMTAVYGGGAGIAAVSGGIAEPLLPLLAAGAANRVLMPWARRSPGKASRRLHRLHTGTLVGIVASTVLLAFVATGDLLPAGATVAPEFFPALFLLIMFLLAAQLVLLAALLVLFIVKRRRPAAATPPPR